MTGADVEEAQLLWIKEDVKIDSGTASLQIL